MPTCFQEGNTATEGSDTRRSMIKLANIGAKNITPPPDEPTATLQIIGPNIIDAGITAVIVRITMSEARLVDTTFTIISENENVYLDPDPFTILAGATTKDLAVGSSIGGGVTPFNLSATATGVTVLNSVTLVMA